MFGRMDKIKSVPFKIFESLPLLILEFHSSAGGLVELQVPPELPHRGDGGYSLGQNAQPRGMKQIFIDRTFDGNARIDALPLQTVYQFADVARDTTEAAGEKDVGVIVD